MPGSYVNSGTANTASSSTSTSPLPASRTNGNTLIAHVHVSGGGVTFSIGGGWTIIDQVNQGAGNDAALAWRTVDGTEADPSFTLSGATGWICKVHQFSGMTSSPIGNKTKGSGDSATLVVGAVTASADNSLIGAFMSVSDSGVIPTPTGYTRREHSEAGLADIVADEVVSTSGTPSDAVSVSIANTAWAGFLVELLYNDPIKIGTAVLSGSGSLSAAARIAMRAVSTLSGVGAIAVDTVSNQVFATLPGGGNLVADATTNAVRVALPGAGNISVNARLKSSFTGGAAVLLTGL